MEAKSDDLLFLWLTNDDLVLVRHFSSEEGLSLALAQSSIGVGQHDTGSVAEGEHYGEGNHAHHGIGSGITQPGLLEGLLPVSARGSSRK